MQSLYAVCALALAGLLALNVQRGSIRDSTAMARTEVEVVALATAEDGLDWAETLRFDAQADAATVVELTPRNQFGTDAATFDAATDLDDLDGATRSGDVAMGTGTVTLDVEASVRYVVATPAGPTPVAARTGAKELTLRVTGPAGAEVSVSRLYPFRAGL